MKNYVVMLATAQAKWRSSVRNFARSEDAQNYHTTSGQNRLKKCRKSKLIKMERASFRCVPHGPSFAYSGASFCADGGCGCWETAACFGGAAVEGRVLPVAAEGAKADASNGA